MVPSLGPEGGDFLSVRTCTSVRVCTLLHMHSLILSGQYTVNCILFIVYGVAVYGKNSWILIRMDVIRYCTI